MKPLQTGAKICHRCGRPPALSRPFGSNRDGLYTEYRHPCFRDGCLALQDMALTEKAEPFIRFLHKTKKADGRTSVQKELALRKQDQPGSKRWKLREVTCREYVKAINTAVHFIKEHLQEKISLRDLAETVHISGFHFHRIFKAIQGECPGRYIQRLRMEKALSGLTANRTLAEIAEQTGYQSPHALSKAFRKYYGISPSEWRKYPQYPVGGKTAVDPESFA